MYLIQKARQRASAENRTLNDVFREWLEHYATQTVAVANYDELMARLAHIQVTQTLSREELNER